MKVSVALDELQQLEASGTPEELHRARLAFVSNYPNEQTARQIQTILDAEAVPTH